MSTSGHKNVCAEAQSGALATTATAFSGAIMRILGIILIVAGALGLAYGGFSYTRRRDTVHLGPMSATITQRESVPIPPILGGIAVIAGIALLVVGKRKQA